MAASTRRAALGAILTAPLASVSAVAASPSDLAAACVAAADQWVWVKDPGHPDELWPDERMDQEIDRVCAVLQRSIDEPSTCLRDLAGKARLMIAEHDDGDQYLGHRALIALLREEVTLCA